MPGRVLCVSRLFFSRTFVLLFLSLPPAVFCVAARPQPCHALHTWPASCPSAFKLLSTTFSPGMTCMLFELSFNSLKALPQVCSYELMIAFLFLFSISSIFVQDFTCGWLFAFFGFYVCIIMQFYANICWWTAPCYILDYILKLFLTSSGVHIWVHSCIKPLQCT